MGGRDDLAARAGGLALLLVHQPQLAAVVVRRGDLLGQFLTGMPPQPQWRSSNTRSAGKVVIKASAALRTCCGVS